LFLSELAIGGTGAVVYVNFWSNSIATGDLLDATPSIFIPHGFFGYTNFFFPTPLPLVAGTTYYFQPFVQSGDTEGNFTVGVTTGNNYPNGTAFFNGAPSGFDLLFREGLFVPEPSPVCLLLLGFGALYCVPKGPRESGRLAEKRIAYRKHKRGQQAILLALLCGFAAVRAECQNMGWFSMKNLRSPAYPYDFCTNCAHYARGDGTFWVDDRDLEGSLTSLSMMSSETLSPPFPGDDDGGGDTNFSGWPPRPFPDFDTNGLWLERTTNTVDGVNLVLHNKAAGNYCQWLLKNNRLRNNCN
jgi:hypothetical protein